MPEPRAQEARFNRLYERHFDAVRASARPATMQPLRPGALEDEGGHHASSLRGYDAAIAEMKRGEPTLVSQFLRANC